MTHRQVLAALSGLVIAIFIAVLSTNIVLNALPSVINDLHGTQADFIWVITITFLVSTATTVLWGKLADLLNKKLVLQLAIAVFVAGSVLSGLAVSTGQLIAFRGLQGLGLGGVLSLTQIVLAMIISPRERGRYAGYVGMANALGGVSGPLIGGVIVDTSWLGWRWCFLVSAPVAVIALIVLQWTLHLPHTRRHVKVDYLGAALLTSGVSLLMVWTTLAGRPDTFAWASVQTLCWVGGGVACLVLAFITESRAAEPIIPPDLLTSRTTALTAITNFIAGAVTVSAAAILSQYLQLSRGYTPSQAGLLVMPLMLSLVLATAVSGRVITRWGRWKYVLVTGVAIQTLGLCLMALLDSDTPIWTLAVFMALVGLGNGMTMQNIIVVAQNSVRSARLGAASSLMASARVLGAAIGVSVFGTLLSSDLARRATADSGKLSPADQAAVESLEIGAGKLPDLGRLPAHVRDSVDPVVTGWLGDATGTVFLIAGPLSALALVAVFCIKEVPLKTISGLEEDRLASGFSSPKG